MTCLSGFPFLCFSLSQDLGPVGVETEGTVGLCVPLWPGAHHADELHLCSPVLLGAPPLHMTFPYLGQGHTVLRCSRVGLSLAASRTEAERVQAGQEQQLHGRSSPSYHYRHFVLVLFFLGPENGTQGLCTKLHLHSFSGILF